MGSDSSFRSVLGKTAIQISPLIIASWSFAGRKGPFGGQLQSTDVERAFHELGVNTFFVTPKMKHLAEGVRRLVRSGHRDEIVIISVAGLPFSGRVLAYWNRCTRELGLERIDLFLMGWVQHRFYLRPAVWSTMNLLKESGKVRALGFSIHNRLLAARLVHELTPAPDVLMIRYNAAHRGAEPDIFESLPEEKPGIIAYTATRWGDLLKPQPESGFSQPMTPPECYRFVLMHPAVDSVLCGARTYEELEADTSGVKEGPLASERYEEILRFGDAVHKKGGRRSSRFMFRQG